MKRNHVIKTTDTKTIVAYFNKVSKKSSNTNKIMITNMWHAKIVVNKVKIGVILEGKATK